MNLISREALKAKLERGEDFKLVMVLGEWAFRAKHIPGSINIFAPELAAEQLGKDDDIVVYCTNPGCVASQYAYNLLTEKGFQKVKRYQGGLEDWEAAGLPLEGDMVQDLQLS